MIDLKYHTKRNIDDGAADLGVKSTKDEVSDFVRLFEGTWL